MNVIQIENLWKEYRLGVIGHGTLSQDLQSWWAKILGKEDPNSRIVPTMKAQEKQIEGDRFWALQDINLEVKEGDLIGIIGKNGAGKSTLLKILSRVTAPSKGNIKIKGRIASLLEVGTGFHPELTGRENVFLNGAILGMSKREISRKFDEIVDFSGIETFIDTPVKRYSSGMYVRLAFAVAAHLEPEILIIDEVLAVGDVDFQKKCLGKMGAISHQGRTILFVSHNLASIKALCTSGIEISQGIIKNSGSVDDVVNLYVRKANDFGAAYYRPGKAMEKTSSKIILIEAFITNDKNENISKYSFNESIIFCVYFKITTDVSYLRFGIEICDAMGTVLFVSIDTDKNNLNGVNRSIGSYREKVTIPANLLLPGEYYINIFSGTPRIERYLHVEECISFEIFEENSHLSHITGEKRKGVIGVPLKWEVKNDK